VRLRQEIRALQQKVGVTTIMVTHDQEEALSVADRIVVMNHGAIEQVGTPLQVYREPASPFVADFVGKVNVLPARSAVASCGSAPAHPVRRARARGARLPASRGRARPPHRRRRPHVFDASIEKIEFLGSFCHVHVASPAIEPGRLTVYLSLNYLSEQSLSVGSPLRLKLLPERIKVF
jgi:iron(III) transport system ATP-binding protein